MSDEKTNPNVEHRVIKGLINKEYHFDTQKAALEFLDHIKKEFPISNLPEHMDDPQSIVLKIVGYALTETEQANGRQSNFARINIEEVSNDDFALILTKIYRSKLEGKKGDIKYASHKQPTITALHNQTFRHSSKLEALKRLQQIKTEFTVSAKEEDISDPESFVFWIRGYAITPSERDGNYLGNFARVQIKELSNSAYTLVLTKIARELSKHPEQGRDKHPHPNWGHPILRNEIKKRMLFRTEADAQEKLAQLHAQFPNTSIPATQSKLYLMIFEGGKKPPVQRYVLTVEYDEQSQKYFITANRNATSSKELRLKVYEQYDSLFVYAYGEKSIVDQSVSDLLGDSPSEYLEKNK